VGAKTRSAKDMPNTLNQSEGIFLMAFVEKTLVCKDCGKEFVFSAGEQEFYAEKGFKNEPVRCKSCRDERKKRNGFAGRKGQKQMYDAVCAECGSPTQVPFKPRNGRPIYCSSCFMKNQ
jgi:CxxC-x17-CxxC domain-containing protein